MKMEEKLSFREAQLGAYEILKFLDELCRKHKFRYFLMYGSLIGAVRNKGIIPWDDDVDIMMPRKDYDQLISYCREHGDDIKPFVLFENSLNINYPHPIARMSDSRYRLDFENEKDYGLGLFVDIYPLDGAGNNIKGAHKLVHKSYRNASLCFLTSRKKFGVDNTKSKMKMALKVPAYLWANAFGNAHYIKKANKLSLFGMGRGAGNAKTELLADYVNKHCGGHYDLQKLLETIDKYIMPILPEIHWGYDLPMYVCGTKHSHVDNVYHLKKAYNCTANEMYDVVDKLEPQQRTRYGTGYSKTDFSVLDAAYEAYREENK